MDSGYTGRSPTGLNKILRLELGNFVKELVVVVKGEKNKSGYKMRERRRGGRKPMVNLKSKDEGRIFL